MHFLLRHARPSLTSSCPTPIGHLFHLQIAGQEIAGQAGNDDMVPCTSFFSVMPFLHYRHARPSFLVMPDSDRASLPHQIAGQEIAGQAGNDDMVPNNDDMVPCPSSSVMPDPDRASTNVNCQKK